LVLQYIEIFALHIGARWNFFHILTMIGWTVSYAALLSTQPSKLALIPAMLAAQQRPLAIKKVFMDKGIYQKQYDFELEQRIAIASSTNTPIVALTVIGGAVSSMILGYPYSTNNDTVAFCFFVAGCVIAILIALIYIFKSLIGYSYQKVPSVIALSNHYAELKEWHKNNGANETVSVELADKDYDEYFYQRLSEAAENNGNNNLKRGNYIHDAMVSISISLTFLIVSVPFFIYEKISNNV